MEKIKIIGGNRLNGEIAISGAKNAALPLMIASLLSEEEIILENLPALADVKQLKLILQNHGCKIREIPNSTGEQQSGMKVGFHAKNIDNICAPYDLVSKMRASFWVIGPLLARMGEAKVSLPGGCAIGTRPVDFFLNGLRQLGAKIEINNGYVLAKAPKGGLVGNRVRFEKISVGATHTIMMAAVLARGTTIIENAAREPEVADLANCLNKMGAKIEGIGTDILTIEGVKKLSGTKHATLPDRIESGTYAMAVAMVGGNVLLKNTSAKYLQTPLKILGQAGVEIIEGEEGNNNIRIIANGAGLRPIDIATKEYPGFPTDLQAQYMALMTRSAGTAKIKETIFENRFMHVAELARFGANIKVEGQSAIVKGVPQLYGAEVMATDLRASVSLVIAGLAAKGETIVSRIYHLDRGFENLEEKLTNCGAQIERIKV